MACKTPSKEGRGHHDGTQAVSGDALPQQGLRRVQVGGQLLVIMLELGDLQLDTTGALEAPARLLGLFLALCVCEVIMLSITESV